MNLINAINPKKQLLISLLIVSYFMVIYSLHNYHIDFVLLGVFREILTIPFIIAQFVFLLTGIRLMIFERNQRHLSSLSVILLAICTMTTMGSFFK